MPRNGKDRGDMQTPCWKGLHCIITPWLAKETISLDLWFPKFQNRDSLISDGRFSMAGISTDWRGPFSGTNWTQTVSNREMVVLFHESTIFYGGFRRWICGFLSWIGGGLTVKYSATQIAAAQAYNAHEETLAIFVRRKNGQNRPTRNGHFHPTLTALNARNIQKWIRPKKNRSTIAVGKGRFP